MYPLSVLDVVEELKRESPPGMVESAVTGMCTLLEKAENCKFIYDTEKPN